MSANYYQQKNQNFRSKNTYQSNESIEKFKHSIKTKHQYTVLPHL